MLRLWLPLLLGAVAVFGERCPSDWVEVDGHCYFLSTFLLKYTDAEASCNDREARLASLADDRAFNVIGAIVKGDKQNFWVGLSRPEGTGAEAWKWDDGSDPPPPAERWYQETKPPAQEGFDCAQFRWNEPSFQVQGCSNQRKYICRRDINVLDKCDYANGWQPYDTLCFRYYEADLSWTDAREACLAVRGDLAVLDTQKKHAVFNEIVNCKPRTNDIWFGLSDLLHTQKQLHWVNGNPMGAITDWDDNQPAYNEGDASCVAATVSRSYKWQVNQCGTTNKFVCERPEGVCADGWETFPDMNYCYLKVTDPAQQLSWIDAQNRCKAYGGGNKNVGQLIKARNTKEHATMKLIAAQMKDAGHGRYRMGVSDYEVDGQWRWADSSTVTFNDPWEDEQPGNVPERMDCGFVNAESEDASWRTLYCFTPMPYVCQIPLHTAPEVIQDPPTYTCPEGWVNYGTECYFFSSESLKFSEARVACQDMEARSRLAEINSAEEQSFISSRIQGNSWFALMYDQNDWLWEESRQKPTFLNWATGEKDHQKPCVRLKTIGYDTGAWASVGCDEAYGFVCRMAAEDIDTGPTQPPTPAWSPFCGPGWRYDATGHHCYKLHYDETVTWEVALGRCRAEGDGSDLASITNLAEQTFINSMIHGTVGGAELYWIGLNDRDMAKGWQWTDGSPVGFFFWNDGEPNNWAGNEYCVEISPAWNDRWNDHRCEALRGFVCKKPSTKLTTPAPTGTTTQAPTTCDNPEPLISGTHYLQDENMRSYYYHEYTGTSYGISEPKREPWNARLDKQDTGTVDVSCPNHETDGATVDDMYVYKEVVGVAGWTHAIIEVMACDEVHIALSDGADILNSNVYEWIVGGWENTRVAYRKCVHPCEDYTYVVTPSLLDCNGYRQFWLTWRDGIIQIGRGRMPNADLIYKIVDESNLINVQHMGLTTAWGRTGKWCVPQEFPAGSAGGWTAYPASTPPQELELRLLWRYAIVSVTTQGAHGRDEWVKDYRFAHRLDTASTWSYAMYGESEIFPGNADRNTKVTNTFSQPILAMIIRITPHSWNNKPSLRLEINGCRYTAETCPLEEPLRVNLPDEQFMSNSGADEPHHARFEARGWVAATPNTAGTSFIQVQFDRHTDIYAIMTKGHREENKWVKTYEFRYARDCWVYEKYQEPYGTPKVFNGNSDKDTAVTNELKAPMRLKCARIYPQTWEGGIAMRLEFKTANCVSGCVPQALIDGENHRIEDFALTASTSWPPPSIHGPHSSRLHLAESSTTAGGWCAGDQNPDADWIQADLGYELRVVAVATQGRGTPSPDQWVTSYYMSYSTDASGDVFTEYMEDGERKIFVGNFEKNLVRKHYFAHWFHARRVRLHPQTWEGHMALRWELYGCPAGVDARRYIGCYGDASERDLPDAFMMQPVGGMTRDICAAHCFDNGYPYSGTQVGYECWCGTSYGKYGVSNACTSRCTGQPNESNMCGGHWANSITSTGLGPAFSGCDSGYTEYNNMCWRIDPDAVATWHDARTACKRDGGDLATIRDQNEMDFLMAQIDLCCKEKWLWIGLHSLQNAYWFEWASGEAITYTNWARREPNSFGGEEDCVHIYPYDGTWNDESCSVYRFNYVCQKSKTPLPSEPPATTPDPTCPEGWVAYRWKCFLLSKNPATWQAKRDSCGQFGGRLARIEDSVEQAFIQSHIAGEDGYFWTDLNDRDNFGSFVYTNGQRPSYTHWAANQPDTTDAATCVALLSSDLGLWYDEPCDDRSYGGLCELDRTEWTRPSTPPTVPGGSCASGWQAHGSSCYMVYDVTISERLTFDDAELYCSNMGANLVSVLDENENLFVYEKVGARASSFWLGGRRAGEGWSWTDGAVFSYANWGDGEPSEEEGRECVSMSHTAGGQWTATGCGAHSNWMCKIPSGQMPHTTPVPTYPTADPDPNACYPDGERWKFYDGRCYFFSGTSSSPDDPPAATWWDAEHWCKTNGGHLASIHDEDTNAFLAGQLLDVQSLDIWIGLNSLDGQYNTWSDGTAAAYFKWSTDGTSTDEMCVSMLGRNGKLGYWRPRHCLEPYHFMCVKNKGATTIVTQEPTIRPGGCPDGYKMFESKCFRFVPEQMSWSQANEKCRENGASYNLASISNVWEQSFLTEMLLTNRNAFWIGMRMLDHSKQFGWTDNTPANYVNWAQGEPNGGDSEQCVEMWWEDHHAGQWNDASCQSARGYICMTLRDNALPTPQPPSNGRCSQLPDGDKWVLWNNDCYRLLSDINRSWQQAEDRCQQDGAHLSSVLSPYENAFIHAYAGWLHAEFHKTWNLWIGLSDNTHPGRYTWTDLWSPVYMNWGAGQPSMTDGACVQMEFLHGGWEDMDCGYQMWSVCKHSEKDPTVTKPPSSGGCPLAGAGDDWVEYGDHCYLFKAEQKNFAEARMECQFRGGELASIHSEGENNFTHYHTQGINGYNSWWWIGLYKDDKGTLVWADGSGSNFFKWAEGEPSDTDGSQGENCVELYTFNGRWNDMTCGVNNGYVCKARKGDSGVSTTKGPDISPGQTTPTPTPIPTGPSGTPPDQLPSTIRPDIPLPGGSQGSGMTPSGIVGLVFFLLFVCLAAVITVLFIMRRQGRPIPYFDIPPDAPGVENPTYE